MLVVFSGSDCKCVSSTFMAFCVFRYICSFGFGCFCPAVWQTHVSTWIWFNFLSVCVCVDGWDCGRATSSLLQFLREKPHWFEIRFWIERNMLFCVIDFESKLVNMCKSSCLYFHSFVTWNWNHVESDFWESDWRVTRGTTWVRVTWE